MMDVSRRDIDPESLLDYCRRGSDLGLAGNDEFHDLLALLHGSGPGPQEAPRSQVEHESLSSLKIYFAFRVARFGVMSLSEKWGHLELMQHTHCVSRMRTVHLHHLEQPCSGLSSEQGAIEECGVCLLRRPKQRMKARD